MKITKQAAREKGLPFLLTLAILVADQAIKSYIVSRWPVDGGERMISDVFGNELLWIIHVRNNFIAFSLGSGIPPQFRTILFLIVPIVFILLLVVYYFASNEWTRVQRWALAGILGGGAGNIIDRLFPHGGVSGVVDYISVKFFGIFGFERWPTFNIADASIVISIAVWFITIAASSVAAGKKKARGGGHS
jgi:signal peptidase II